MKYGFWILCLFALVPFATAGDAQRGKVKAQTCLGCHGVPSYSNVYPSYHVPKLVGQHAPYLVAALKGYQSGEREHLTMRAQASSLTESDIQDIAAFFSTYQIIAAESSNPPQTTALSDDLRSKLEICASCHGMEGNSPLPENPRLAGQYRDYLYQALLDYQDGKRKNPIMLGMIGVLNETDMDLLARYFSKQRGLLVYPIQHRAILSEK